jgi:hypothetical protein
MAKQECVQPSKDMDTLMHRITFMTSAKGLITIFLGKLDTIFSFSSYWKV